MMKNELSSLDIFILIKELKDRLIHGKIQKIYDYRCRGVRIKIYSFKNKQEYEFIILPPIYFSIAVNRRITTKKEPSSFVMQLRKHLLNSTLTKINQHETEKELERIIELTFIKKDNVRYTLIVELFSKGNIFLCSYLDKKIIGLMERQKWKSRLLKVGEYYKYPPESINPLTLDSKTFKEIVEDKNEKNIVTVIAGDMNFGGIFAEEICMLAGIEKKRKCKDLTLEEKSKVFESLCGVTSKISRLTESDYEPEIIYKGQEKTDTTPYPLAIYSTSKTVKNFKNNFNFAVDEYFFDLDLTNSKAKGEADIFGKKIEKLNLMKKNQEETIRKLKEKEQIYKIVGDEIYQNFEKVKKVLEILSESKDLHGFIGKEINGVKIIKIKNTEVTMEL